MSIMLLLECVSCKKRQQIRQGLVQAAELDTWDRQEWRGEEAKR